MEQHFFFTFPANLLIKSSCQFIFFLPRFFRLSPVRWSRFLKCYSLANCYVSVVTVNPAVSAKKKPPRVEEIGERFRFIWSERKRNALRWNCPLLSQFTSPDDSVEIWNKCSFILRNALLEFSQSENYYFFLKFNWAPYLTLFHLLFISTQYHFLLYRDLL